MEEMIAALVTTLDILVIYMVLRIRKNRLILALWTALLNICIPFIGFMLGQFSAILFLEWSAVLSSVLLSLIGLHMLLQQTDQTSNIHRIPPPLIAFVVSIDAFSVSVTLGMLQFNKMIFIVASGVFSFLFAVFALYLQAKITLIRDKWVRRIAGISLIIIGILSFIR